jgi:hypothetical protein
MTDKNFSRSELYVLRNDIGIDALIKALHVPCETRAGRFAFLCPLCRGYNTSVNHKANLARCFDCQKNINTIDMVMIVRQSDFVSSIRFLKKLHGSRPGSSGCNALNDTKQRSSHDAKHIGQIIDGLITPPHSCQPQSVDQDISARILKLEQKTTALGLQVNELLKLMNRLFPSA